MNVLSLFDGHSGCQIALNSIGLKPNKYYAAEIDKYAIKACLAVYPDTIQLGSVTEWKHWYRYLNWSNIDLVTGGFPCQAWSTAGKQLGDKDERGMLFWTMLDIIKECKKHNPKVKFLIENVKMKKEFEEYITYHTEQALGEVCKTLINSALVSAQNRNRYYWTNWHVEQPEDKGILLKNIVEKFVLSEFYYTEKQLEKIKPSETNQGKSIKIIAHRQGYRRNSQIFDVLGQTEALDTCQGGGRILGVKDRTERYRKLTPRECGRLQTVPEEILDTLLSSGISNSQLYKMFGNGWTIDVIAHIFKQGLTGQTT